MVTVDKTKLQTYRARTFRILPDLSLRSRSEAVEFVDERGFIFFWPIQGVLLPSLWTAVAGDRPVADAHDDPGHVTWGWKDQLLGGRHWYYAKVLRKKATMISFSLVPYFYALSQNYGAYDEDYLTIYEQGRMTLEAKQVYEMLLDRGPLDTVDLRRLTRMSSPSSESRFNRAITDLQTDFKILPVGVTQSGAWHYAFAYDIVARHHPDLVEDARNISEDESRRMLLDAYARSLGAFDMSTASRLFGWRYPAAERAASFLLETAKLVKVDAPSGSQGAWFSLPELV